MRTALICHAHAPLDRDGLARWLASFSTYTGALVIREPVSRARRRVAREIRRVGWLRFVDVLAFRALYRVRHSAADREWEERALARLRSAFPPTAAPELVVASPNSAEAEACLRERQPDLVIARCKTLLAERIFSMPTLGTFVLHPGICPEYRNAHGCFWALARGDVSNVGATLLKIDRGVDTGPVFGHFRVAAEYPGESHIVVQHRAVLEHLDAIRDRLLDVEAGRAMPIDVAGRPSAEWGQPWLTAHLSRLKAQGLRLTAAHVLSPKP